jgi:protein transport protein SEC20
MTLQSLEVSVQDQRGEVNRRALTNTVHSFRDEVVKCVKLISLAMMCREHTSRMRKDFRAAVLTSKRRIDSQSQSNREELMRSSLMRGAQSEKAA